jgi:hydrogenase maturation protein HypF
VQGVGFRPFVYRLARELGLRGWVLNAPDGVFVEAEGDPGRLGEFLRRVHDERPPRAVIQSLEHSVLDPAGYAGFEIRHSETGGEPSTLVLPDIATCPDCLREILDPGDRRYRYPFTNCTNCGPRFSILESLPYDRRNTTMKGFAMCPACRREYDDPLDRRFHAQPIACPRCGPHLELWDSSGALLASLDEALLMAASSLADGKIVAVKGLGGFHLMVDARNEDAVRRLRARKHREEKPLALMCPSLETAASLCRLSPAEERLLLSPESPIVLAERRHGAEIAASVAPGNPQLGVMLPYTPLHHLLMNETGFPVVATSGNSSDEPICTDEHEAVRRLGRIADVLLVHNRPIERHVDDSVVRFLLGREQILRRARGYAPLPLAVRAPRSWLAVGAQLKNAVALSVGDNVFVSQHIGDLETVEAFAAFKNVIGAFARLYDVRPAAVVCDLHPDYGSARYAKTLGCRVVGIQHHHAHVASCMAENELEGRVLGIAWDGAGYGADGTLWGGEFLLTDATSFTRAGSLRPFLLPGGEHAMREPRRSAAGLLYEVLGEEFFTRAGLATVGAFSHRELDVLARMLRRRLNAPATSSAGRLFDAVASIVGLRHRSGFEGQAAMELEFLAYEARTDAAYAFHIAGGPAPGPAVVDWEPMVLEMLDDLRSGVDRATIAMKYHNTLVEMMAAMALRVGEERVVLTGGCFQNRCLTEKAVERLRREGFRPYWHQRVPPNDGGIALGQLAAVAGLAGESEHIEQPKETADVPGYSW